MKKKGEERCVHIIYTVRCALDASVFHLSIIIIAETSTGNRPPIAIAARLGKGEKKLPDNRIINSGIGVAGSLSREARGIDGRNGELAAISLRETIRNRSHVIAK